MAIYPVSRSYLISNSYFDDLNFPIFCCKCSRITSGRIKKSQFHKAPRLLIAEQTQAKRAHDWGVSTRNSWNYNLQSSTQVGHLCCQSKREDEDDLSINLPLYVSFWVHLLLLPRSTVVPSEMLSSPHRSTNRLSPYIPAQYLSFHSPLQTPLRHPENTSEEKSSF